MILRRRLALMATALLLVALSVLSLSRKSSGQSRARAQSPELTKPVASTDEKAQLPIHAPRPADTTTDVVPAGPSPSPSQTAEEESELTEELDENEQENEDHGVDHREIFSLTTRTRKFSIIYWNGEEAYNANVIPHPTRHDYWILVAQRRVSSGGHWVAEEISCEASYLNDALICDGEPKIVPVEPAIHPGLCEGDINYFDNHSGPKDARVFYGPDGPLIAYGSQSAHTCFGIWVRDARMVLDAFAVERYALSRMFSVATEVQRPEPWGPIEKNFFLFWDLQGRVYAHHDIYPQRVFAQLDIDGSVGPNLATASAYDDQICMSKYMPRVGKELQSIHQATNSLSITLCKRSDRCIPDDKNTFVLTIFQHKKYFGFHAVYEPYVMLFQQAAPFAVHAIGQRPLWISGRGPLTSESRSAEFWGRPAEDIPQGHTEMFYVTSISWKGHDQKYHGYLDDVVFLAFGIEDTQSGVIDVKVSDLLQDLAFC